jgi:hypothetical protein
MWIGFAGDIPAVFFRKRTSPGLAARLPGFPTNGGLFGRGA